MRHDTNAVAAMGTIVVLCLWLFACAAPTAADRGRTIQGALAAGKAACLILLADESIPRDASAVAHCQAVLSGCGEATP